MQKNTKIAKWQTIGSGVLLITIVKHVVKRGYLELLYLWFIKPPFQPAFGVLQTAHHCFGCL